MSYSRVPATASPRPGFHSVTPRIVISDLEAQVEFLRTLFDAVGTVSPGRPAEIRVGNSLIMESPSTEREPFPAFLYVFIADADQVYQLALAAGAVSLEQPDDTPLA